MTNYLKIYLDQLTSQYPILKNLSDLEKRFEFLISDITISLPQSVYRDAELAVKNIFAHAHSESFIADLKKRSTIEELALLNAPVQNHSVLMAYDFHYNSSTDKLSLIEINTNASAFLISEKLYSPDLHGHAPWGDSLSLLKNSFLSELHLNPIVKTSPTRIAIIDDQIEKQKMYPEFLMFQSLFKSWGWEAELKEQTEVHPENFDIIYNRSTDFLFSKPDVSHLREAFCAASSLFSPQPREYLLLAAKDRLIDFSKDKISDTIPDCYELKNHPDPDFVWENRKKLFFKPLRLYGSKGAYRGSSISRKIFQDLLNQDFLAQEYAPPGTQDDWKFDLRFFTYKDQIQLGCARVYKGQVTNFLSPGGGLSRLSFV